MHRLFFLPMEYGAIVILFVTGCIYPRRARWRDAIAGRSAAPQQGSGPAREA